MSFLQSSHQSTGIYVKCIITIWPWLLFRTGRRALSVLAVFTYLWIYGLDGCTCKRTWSHKVALNGSKTAKTKLDFQSQLCSGRKKERSIRYGGYGGTWGQSFGVIPLAGLHKVHVLSPWMSIMFAFSNSMHNLLSVDFTIFLFSELLRLLVIPLSHSALICLPLGASINYSRI